MILSETSNILDEADLFKELNDTPNPMARKYFMNR